MYECMCECLFGVGRMKFVGGMEYASLGRNYCF
jgi:hypothetical protein